jgi:hypothetical protein
MWRFIVLSFGFLFVAFYELSGGADYAPAPNSIQARALIDDQRPRARPGSTAPARIARAEPAPPEPQVTRAAAAPADPVPGPGLGGRNADAGPRWLNVPTVSADPLARLSDRRPAPDTRPAHERDYAPRVSAAVSRASLAGSGTKDAPAAKDIRRVTASAANMRGGPGTRYDRLDRLTRGDAVTVLRDPGNGWLKLRANASGRVGWIAASLIGPATN